MRASQFKIQFLRRRAFAAQDGLCYYCLQPMGRHVTAEHLVARADGGRNTRSNIVAACRRCSASRHALFPAEAPDPETYQAFVLLMRKAGLWPIERP
ncbi:HNH endonuclease [Variovorax sp. YR750]|uniref:HNH endonuclease n=1 Tax=Variovorax sp. YR750 TaxID=1884384 RepID=UPI0008CF55B2|nr:HNH endonuclease [Variovorax sp. YR750]SEM25869.1 HNH endonuclease [Variovorax sp. YR750]